MDIPYGRAYIITINKPLGGEMIRRPSSTSYNGANVLQSLKNPDARGRETTLTSSFLHQGD
jgi:hypothetical protein